jgi:protocatechuate 3,4-dioxygenase beta subunit
MTRSIIALLAAGSFAMSMGAQAQLPPRDQSTPPPVGTARIRGRVIAADTGAPLHRAQVRVGGAEPRVMRSVSTDAEGRFDVTDLPAGTYFLTVTRNGYASLQFGQQQPFSGGRPLEIANGQLIDHIDFALPRASVITGRVTDQLGEPVAGIHMEALRYRYLAGGERELAAASMRGTYSMVTNDLGEFRVSGLMPGTYVLRANPFEGGLSGMRGIVNGGVAWAQQSDINLAYTTTYYPGTPSPEQAESITLGVGDIASASFALSTARLSRVSGTVRDSEGRPVTGASIELQSRTRTSGWFMSGPQISADGKFSMVNVPPGDYSITVVPMSARIRPPVSAEFNEVASVPFTAAGQDITDLIITTTPGATVTGRVTFEGSSKAARPDRVAANAPDHKTNVVYRRDGENGAIDASGGFQLRGIVGRATFRTYFADYNVRDEAWSMKSVTLNGADITDTPIDIPSAGEISGIEITLTDTLTRLSGTVTNARRETVKDYVVVFLPEGLKEGVRSGRFHRTARPNQAGRYEVRGLPPGDYLAVAVAALEDGNEWDPAFRKQVEPNAKRFRLTHGQEATLDLELMP